MKQKHFIDSQKGITFLVVLTMMAAFDRWHNATAWVYLALHGTYGWLWVLKGKIFPDKQWEARCSIWYGLYIWAGLSLYWIAPYLITRYDINAPTWLLGLSVAMYAVGVFLHFGADMQKYTALQLAPGQLITSGFFRYTRNPNYLGELMIYLGFSILAMHWAPLLAIGLFIFVIWVPNMLRKEHSLARHAGFEEYQRLSKLLIPFIL